MFDITQTQALRFTGPKATPYLISIDTSDILVNMVNT